MAKVLIAGFGDVGQRLARYLLAAGYEVVGASRGQPAKFRELWLPLDLFSPTTFNSIPNDLDYVIYMPTPSRRDEAGYRAIYLEALQSLYTHLDRHASYKKPDWVYVSSTSVYGQTHGEWVDEASPTTPLRYSGRVLLEAERWLLVQDGEHHVLRLTGIYGPGRERLLKKIQAGSEARKLYYTNRIHSEDCARLLTFLLEQKSKAVALEQYYIGVDDEPAEEAEVFQWLAHRFGFSEPSLVMAPESSRNKRCSNARVKQLGFQLQYPSFREGWESMME